MKAMSRGLGILGPLTPDLFDPSMTFEAEDYAIGGQMLTVKMEVDAVNELVMNDEEWRKLMRHKLAVQLATAMLDQDLMETTTFEDPKTLRKTIAARCYLAPHDQVKILRVHKR
jgi:hypothetical protein